MSNPQQTGIESFVVKMAASSYQIDQHLLKGTYRLLIVAPFGTKILVTPLNPPVGFQFQPDMDAATEIWNSLLVTPQDGQYAFLVMIDKPLENAPLHVQFVLQSSEAQPSPPPAPPPSPPPAPPPGDMQQSYQQQGYQINYDGAVVYYYVAFRTNKTTQQREICMLCRLSYSDDLHDPARSMAKFPKEDPTHRYNRMGPFPIRAQAEASAIQFATTLFGDPTRYGIWIVSGGFRQPVFN